MVALSSLLPDRGGRTAMTASQKMMVFVLAMSLYGISNMITELLPELRIGPVELKVEYFIFIPLTLAVLLHPLYAAIGASFGEVIFGEILLGQFSGLGELEKFIQFSLGVYIAGLLVTNPLNRRQLAVAAYTAIGIDQLLGTIVDIGKVYVGIEEFEAVPGLPEAVLAVEGFGFLNAMAVSGTLFSLLPTLYLVPRLYGKIEPLMGMKPREKRVSAPLSELVTPRLAVIAVVLAAVALAAEFLAESDFNPLEWETSYADDMGTAAIWISMGVGVLLLLAVLLVTRRYRRSQHAEETKF